MDSRLLKRTLKEMEKTSMLASALVVESSVIQAASTTITKEQLKQAAKVEKYPGEDRLRMRNRISEKEKQLKIVLDLAGELSTRALKTKRNEEHEILLKCSEILQDYASGLAKDILK